MPIPINDESGFHTLFNLVDVGILIQDAETGQILAVNDRACAMHGSSREQILVCQFKDLMNVEPPYSEVEALENIRRLQAEGPQTFEWLVQAADGHRFWIEVRLHLAVLDGQPRVVALLRDIDQKKHLSRALDKTQGRVSALLEALPDILFIVDQDGRMLECIPPSVDKLFAPVEALIGRTVSEVLPEEPARIIMAALTEAKQQGGHRGATYALDLPQGRRWFSLSIAPLPESRSGTQAFVALAHDITDLQRAHEHIEYLAYRDPLTGLPNRNYGRDQLEQAVARAHRDQKALALLSVDLSGFKYINNGYGHAIGDQLLKAVGRRLARRVRHEDTLCRLSADEFLVILPGLDRDHLLSQVAQISERLLDAVNQPFSVESLDISTSASIGITLYPQDGDDAERLMRQAHTALGQAKRLGQGNYVFFEPRMNHDLLRFNLTRDAIRTALTKDEFALYYQPQIHLQTGKVVGVEALIRWRHPKLGLIEPMGFIEAAEESGLIVPMGRWVLQEAGRQAAAWHEAGWSDLVMAVNLSAKQVVRKSLVADIESILAECCCEPHWLELELTESMLLHDLEAIKVDIGSWKRLGIKVTIDDFGTGYSSLAYLKQLQIDKLKIDKSFVENLLTDASDRAIIQAILHMAKALNLGTLAEGVENEEMARLLLEMGCDEAQGYHYAKPMSAKELEKWLASRDHN